MIDTSFRGSDRVLQPDRTMIRPSTIRWHSRGAASSCFTARKGGSGSPRLPAVSEIPHERSHEQPHPAHPEVEKRTEAASAPLGTRAKTRTKAARASVGPSRPGFEAPRDVEWNSARKGATLPTGGVASSGRIRALPHESPPGPSRSGGLDLLTAARAWCESPRGSWRDRVRRGARGSPCRRSRRPA